MTLSLNLLGTPDIRVDGVPLEVDTSKAIALLAYLAVEGGSHPRDRLVDLLWPDSDVDRARSTLRRTLSALRSGLGGRWVTADRTFVSFDRDGVVVDIDDMRRTAADHLAHPSGEFCDGCIADLGRAADMWRGDFLDGFYARGAAPFEGWTTTRAEEQRRSLSEVLRCLATARAAEGSYPQAIDAARRRIDVDPLTEESHRDLMLYQAWSGDRSGAIDSYRRLVSILDVELGVPPLDETTLLYESVLEDDIPPAPAPPRRPVVTTERTAPPTTPLVGRTAELSEAVSLLQTQGGIVVVSGEMGSGLTRFLDEVSTHLQNGGATILRASGSASATGVPYGVIHAALYGALSDDEQVEKLGALPDQVLAEASRLFPGLAPRVPPPTEHSNRAGFLDALSRVVGVIVRPVLVVDDAHLSDAASAETIAFLAGTARHTGLSILLASSQDESSPEVGVTTVLRDLAHRGTVIPLLPLDEEAVAELAHWFGLDLDPTVVIARAGGLPLFTVEMLRAAAEGSETAIPDQIRRAVADRVAGLDGASHQVLDALAVIDRPADDTLIAAVSGRSADETDAALDTLVTAGLIREFGDGTVTIAHSYLAGVVLEAATVARRRMLNRRAARATEMRSGAPGLASRIARHHSLAGNDAKAAHWSVIAGDEAAAVFAHREAISHYEAAIAADHPDRAALHRAIAHSALLDGRYDQAMAAYESALAAGDTDTAGAEHRLGEIHRRLRRWDIAAAHYDRAVASTADPALGSIISSDRAYVERQRSGPAAAAVWVDTALELAEASGNGAALARAHNVAGLVSTDPAERRRHLEEALQHAIEPGERVAVLNNLAAVSEPDEAVTIAREALAEAHSLGDRHLTAALHNTLADALHAIGDTEGSRASLTEAVELFAEITAGGDEGWVPEVWFLTEW